MPARSRRIRRRLSLTSLIDVIFLLLLFFMLSSTFSRFAEVELTAGGAGTSSDGTAPLFLLLGREHVLLNGQRVTLADLPKALDDAGSAEAPRALLVSLRRDVSAQRLTDLLVALRTVDGVAPTILEPA